MKYQSSNFIYLFTTLACFVLAFVAIVGIDRTLSYRPPVVDENAVSQLFSQFRSQYPPLFTIHLDEKWMGHYPRELIDPEAVVADPQRSAGINLDSCQNLKSSKNKYFRKLQLWQDFHCGRVKQPSPELWRTPPLIHPLGGSWAYWLFQQKVVDRKWLKNEQNYLHLLERQAVDQEPTDPFFRVVADFGPEDLQLFEQGAVYQFTQRFAILTAFTDSENGDAIHVYDRALWDYFLSDRHLQVKRNISDNCLLIQKPFCWQIQSGFVRPAMWPFTVCGILALSGFLLIPLMLVRSRSQIKQRSQKNQNLVMQTLAHELRHPVMSLMLLTDIFRDNYENLSENLRVQFLRLASLSARLQRLVHKSHQYLKLLDDNEHFEFQIQIIPSLREFVEQVLEAEELPVSIAPNSVDMSCCFDRYWVAVCLQNLIINAYKHGQPPIVIKWKRQHDDLVLTVEDHGSGPQMSLFELVKPHLKGPGIDGMGLGLSLVHRLLQRMHSQLHMTLMPTRFSMHLRGVCRDQFAAG